MVSALLFVLMIFSNGVRTSGISSTAGGNDAVANGILNGAT
jgi:hypothetical protein